jgi:hypothetical protein
MRIALYCTTRRLILLGGYLLTAIAKAQNSKKAPIVMIHDQRKVGYTSQLKGAYSWYKLLALSNKIQFIVYFAGLFLNELVHHLFNFLWAACPC